MEQTPKYGLNKPGESDYCDVSVLNENVDTVEVALDGLEKRKAALGADGKVPVGQLPSMNYDPAGSAAAVQTGLNSHTSNKSNPHGVTAAQVGAAAANHTHTAAQVGAAATAHKHSAADLTSGTLAVARGGTGKTSWTANRLIYPTGASSLGELAPPTVGGAFLRQNASGAPYWSSPDQVLSAVGGVKLLTITYTGTGTYGGANPTKIAFPTTPLLWTISTDNKVGQVYFGKVSGTFWLGNSSDTEVTVSWSGNTVSFVSNRYAGNQNNEKNIVYTIVYFCR